MAELIERDAIVSEMAIIYEKLWKLLIDKGMKKKDLGRIAGISSSTLARLGKDENVSSDMLNKICMALGCDIGDVMEIVESE